MTENIWSAEDDKLATLAKGARSRIQADCGAAVRDTTGRTYLTLSAVQLAVGQAVASGAVGIEAVVVTGDSKQIDLQDIEVVRSIGGLGVPVYQVGTTGEIVSSQLT
ncbi:MAG: cytidine deaminase [Burkholderiaceae bacterium]|nr:cytidine deaminase [Burkholderiaceae bacterium]